MHRVTWRACSPLPSTRYGASLSRCGSAVFTLTLRLWNCWLRRRVAQSTAVLPGWHGAQLQPGGTPRFQLRTKRRHRTALRVVAGNGKLPPCTPTAPAVQPAAAQPLLATAAAVAAAAAAVQHRCLQQRHRLAAAESQPRRPRCRSWPGPGSCGRHCCRCQTRHSRRTLVARGLSILSDSIHLVQPFLQLLP